jgi:hypothetical protein
LCAVPARPGALPAYPAALREGGHAALGAHQGEPRDRAAAAQDCRDAIANLRLSSGTSRTTHIDWTDHIFRSQDVFEKRLDMRLGGERGLKRQPKSEPYSVPTITPAPVAEQQIAPEADPWRKVLASLAASVNPHSYDIWLKPTRFYARVEGTLYVRVPTPEFRNLGEKYGDMIAAALLLQRDGTQSLGPILNVVYVTHDEARARAKEAV